MRTYLIVQVAGEVPARLADDLADDFGIYPHVESGADRALDVAAAEVAVIGAVGAFFMSVVQQFGVRAADNLARGFGRLLRLSAGEPSGAAAHLLLLDEATGIRYLLSADAVASTEAMQTLLAFDAKVFKPETTVHWDPVRGCWSAGRE